MSTAPIAGAHVSVLLAAAGLPGEPRIVADLARGRDGVRVARRCVDAVDVVAAASAGLAEIALVGPELPRMTADTVAALRGVGVRVVGLCPATDPLGRARLDALGIDCIVEVDEGVAEVPGRFARSLLDVIGSPGETTSPAASTAASTAAPPGSALGSADDASRSPNTEVERGATAGSLVAVWGPTGAPGRTSVALGLADELAHLGTETLLVDADTRGSALATLLGVVDDISGIAVACRQADAGSLTVEALAQAARSLSPTLRILTGLPDERRWRELRDTSLERLWATARRLCSVVVADVGFDLGDADIPTLDRGAPARSAVAHADAVVVVGVAEPLGIERLLAALDLLRSRHPHTRPRVVVTRVRRTVLGRDPEGQIHEVIRRETGIEDIVFIPDDRRSFDACVRDGRTLAEAAPRSPARAPLQALARSLGAATG